MFNLWKCFFEKNHWINLKDDQKFLHTEQEYERFFPKFYDILKNNNINKLNVFWAIHEAYVYAKEIDVEMIKIIMTQEHSNLYFERTLNVFPQSKILMMMRDPRAAFAGWFFKHYNNYGFIPDYTYNFFCRAMDASSRYVEEIFFIHRKEI